MQIETSLNDYLLELVDEADENKDGQINFHEWQVMVNAIKKKARTTAQAILAAYPVGH
jgi:hypothetical protein